MSRIRKCLSSKALSVILDDQYDRYEKQQHIRLVCLIKLMQKHFTNILINFIHWFIRSSKCEQFSQKEKKNKQKTKQQQTNKNKTKTHKKQQQSNNPTMQIVSRKAHLAVGSRKLNIHNNFFCIFL